MIPGKKKKNLTPSEKGLAKETTTLLIVTIVKYNHTNYITSKLTYSTAFTSHIRILGQIVSFQNTKCVRHSIQNVFMEYEMTDQQHGRLSV